MRMPPLLADFIYNRVCELKCEKFLTRPFENAKYPGGKISPLIYYYNRQGAKWPGARTGNKKSSKSFSDLLLSLVAGGGWYSVLKV